MADNLSFVDVQICRDILSVAGLPSDITPNFEENFMSNRKIIVNYGSCLLEVKNVEYFSCPQESPFLSDLVCPNRKMRWQERILAMPERVRLCDEVIDELIHDGFSDGLPMGFVPDDHFRLAEILRIGRLRNADYCLAMDYKGMGEFRLYNRAGLIPGCLQYR